MTYLHSFSLLEFGTWYCNICIAFAVPYAELMLSLSLSLSLSLISFIYLIILKHVKVKEVFMNQWFTKISETRGEWQNDTKVFLTLLIVGFEYDAVDVVSKVFVHLFIAL